jgi:hypothetical protein
LRKDRKSNLTSGPFQAKTAGAKWSSEKKLWLVAYGKIAGTPLEMHIQVDENDNHGKRKKHLYVYA